MHRPILADPIRHLLHGARLHRKLSRVLVAQASGIASWSCEAMTPMEAAWDIPIIVEVPGGRNHIRKRFGLKLPAEITLRTGKGTVALVDPGRLRP